MFNGGGSLIFPSAFVVFPIGICEVASTFVWEWETSTLQRLGKAQALRVYIYR